MEETTEVSTYPLIYTFQAPVRGAGGRWSALVEVTGRAVMRPYLDDGWWLSSVEPEGISGGSRKGAEAARNQFKRHFILFLREFAEDFEDFDEFRSELAKLMRSTSRADEDDWTEAVSTIRHGGGLSENPEVAALAVVDADRYRPRIVVARLDAREASARKRRIGSDYPEHEFLVGTSHAA